MRRIVILLLLGLQMTAFSQVTPSVYVGAGIGANLGGNSGIGTEFRYKMVSVNAAIGTGWLRSQKLLHPDSPSPLGWDVGVKVYPIKGWFFGVNYGTNCEGPYKLTDGQSMIHKESGFSFTTGYHWRFYKGLYGMGFIGITDKKLFLSTIPSFGLCIGWDFLKKESK